MVEPRAESLRPILRAIEQARGARDLVTLIMIAGALEVLADSVRRIIGTRLSEDDVDVQAHVKAPGPDEWIPLSLAARRLGWSMKTLRRHDAERPLPFIIRRDGERPRASVALLEAFMARERRRVTDRKLS